MGRGKLSQEEIIALNNNPFVVSANENRIIYTNEFKFHFVLNYNHHLALFLLALILNN